MIGDAPYTDPSEHKRKIDIAEIPTLPLADNEGLAKQKSTTRFTNDDGTVRSC
jgi:hypothetical protein